MHQNILNLRVLLLLLSLIFFLNHGCRPSGINLSDKNYPSADFKIETLRSDPKRPARPHRKRYKGPLVDTHAHLDPPERGIVIRENLMTILSDIDSVNVDYVILMPTPNEGQMRGRSNGSKYRKTIARMGRGKIGLFCGSEYISNAIHDMYRNQATEKKMNNILKRLTLDLNDERCLGIGEVAYYHFNKTGNQNIIAYPPTFDPFLKVIQAVSVSSKWLDLHAEPLDHRGQSYEDIVFGGLALFHKKFPDLKLIIAHTGMTTPTNARKILKTYPNVMMNFKPIKKHRLWKNLEPVTNEIGYLYEDWAKLFEEMPERFMVGSDEKFGRKGKGVLAPHGKKMARYKKSIKLMRKILGTIDDIAAEKIAFENAVRIFELKGI